MKPKQGRPPLPEGTSNEIVYSAKLSESASEKAEKVRLAAGQGKSEWLRTTAQDEALRPPVWVKSKWTREQLNEKLIEFSLRSKAPQGIRVMEGVGLMRVRENNRGQIAVDIFIDQLETPFKAVTTRIWLSRDAVESIEQLPEGSKVPFRLRG